MEFISFIKDPDKRVRSLVRKLTHSGEVELCKQDLEELKKICKSSKEAIIIIAYRECMACLRKEHSQVRVSTVRLLDYLFQKSHVLREKLLDNFDTFLELTLAITQKPKLKLKLPPPKKFAALLQELTAKSINSWHSDFGPGYEKLRYIYKFLREHRLVDFSHFQVSTHEDIIRRQQLAERQEKILTRSIENRLKEFRELKPQIEQIIAQVESLLDMLLQNLDDLMDNSHESDEPSASDSEVDYKTQQAHGIVNLSQVIEIEFSPYVEVQRDRHNEDIVQNLKELKKQLIEGKMTKLVAIEKTLSKRSDQFLASLKEIIDLKGSDSDAGSDFEDVELKEGLETYIPKSMRIDYGLEPINPKELDDSRNITLIDNMFNEPSTSRGISGNTEPVTACNVRLESGKLCQRKDKIKCPFHGKIIPRDHQGVALNDKDRFDEEQKLHKEGRVPDWQDPELLKDLKAATGIDLTMPDRKKSKVSPKSKLINARTCDLTPQQRLKKRLALMNK